MVWCNRLVSATRWPGDYFACGMDLDETLSKHIIFSCTSIQNLFLFVLSQAVLGVKDTNDNKLCGLWVRGFINQKFSINTLKRLHNSLFHTQKVFSFSLTKKSIFAG